MNIEYPVTVPGKMTTWDDLELYGLGPLRRNGILTWEEYYELYKRIKAKAGEPILHIPPGSIGLSELTPRKPSRKSSTSRKRTSSGSMTPRSGSA